MLFLIKGHCVHKCYGLVGIISFLDYTQTSNQAAFLLYLMAKNPEAQEKLYKQIRSVLGDQAQPTSEDLSKIPYLKGCMMESFRYYSCSCLTL